jgi:hypothetical protein
MLFPPPLRSSIGLLVVVAAIGCGQVTNGLDPFDGAVPGADAAAITVSADASAPPDHPRDALSGRADALADARTDASPDVAAPDVAPVDAPPRDAPLADQARPADTAAADQPIASPDTALPPDSCAAPVGCGKCGGKVLCSGACSVSDPPNLGSACGVAGTVQCNGFCLGPLFRLYNPATGDHFYTMSAAERNSATALGYHSEGTACSIYDGQAPGTVPLYRAFRPGASDHFYTTSGAERNAAIATLGYQDEGITGYVFAAAGAAATVPLYRAYNPGSLDHFYTVSAAERDSAVAGGYRDEGIACYVLPP